MTIVTEPAFRYAVLRPGPGLPDGFLPPDMDGKWFDLDAMPLATVEEEDWSPHEGRAVAVAADRFERSDDGATARVYEVRV